MALSDAHIIRHCVEIQERFLSAGDTKGGGHSGVSLNVYCGILGEKPERLVKLLADLTWDDLPKDLHASAEKRWVGYHQRYSWGEAIVLPSRYFKPAT